ncbi:hypothetical protein [Leucobacter komagatae]|uniref:Sporulation protein YtfJ n=1 Tax=Leucobacter komagatae TaxID=55969 RepID=A0A0D0IVB3_9MICO|nr:hypothetical protein [Leucobacter komagatae]KIP53538.1 hypothetical protein SD72_02330 [Leucobacter komagatae]
MPNITKQIADTVTQTGVQTAYGDAVDLEGTTLLPVAVGGYMFGAGEGGAGTNADGAIAGEGSGGGGGGVALPIGAYVARDGYTRFEPNIIALLSVGVPFVWVAGRALARVIRALKR